MDKYFFLSVLCTTWFCETYESVVYVWTLKCYWNPGKNREKNSSNINNWVVLVICFGLSKESQENLSVPGIFSLNHCLEAAMG